MAGELGTQRKVGRFSERGKLLEVQSYVDRERTQRSVTGGCGFCSAFRPKINLLLAPFSRKLPKINLADESRRWLVGVGAPAAGSVGATAACAMPVMQYGHMLLETSDNDSGCKYVHAVTSANGNTTYQLKVVLQKGGSQTNMGTFSTALAAAVAY